MFEISEQEEQKIVKEGAKIKVIGVGGGGCNVVNTMIKEGLTRVEYIVANTDSQALSASLAPTKVQLGSEITKGLGAGANPEIGKKAALDEYEKLSEVLDGADMVFITAGMGGGTGTGASPVIAKLCKELGALTVGVVTKPFDFEGKKRTRQAMEGITNLEENIDSLITIPNQRLLHIAGEGLSLVDTFKTADAVLLNAVRGISDLINNMGYINADFADVRTVMENKGLALMGTGIASGAERATQAALGAISSPLLEDIAIDGATGIIINIMGNESLTMHETNEAVTLIMDAADDEAEIIFGTIIDDSLENEIKITVIATGLNLRKPERIDAKHYSEKIFEGEPVEEFSLIEEASPEKPEENTHSLADEVREEEKESVSLRETIKEAANRYRATTTKEENEPGQGPPPKKPLSEREERAESIARRLGFIGFDEEELDTPTFLRNNQKKFEGEDCEL